MSQRKDLAGIVQASRVNAIHLRLGIFVREDRVVPRQQEEFASSQHGPIRECKIDSGTEGQSAQVQRQQAGIFQFEKLEFISSKAPEGGRVVHDFGDQQFRKI